MLLPIAIVIGVIIAAILVFAITRPDAFRVERSTTVQASPQKLFDLIDDFHKWGAWSPFEKLDRNVQKTYSGAGRGKGAVYAWAGNSKAGEGRMEITKSIPASNVTIKLDFLKPFEGHNTAEFSVQPSGSSTRVTWAMFGKQNFMIKVMSIFMSMDKMMGKEFEEGLQNMKALAER